ncbi:hypothetical protein KI387_001042, partial [Taxus chinensis]
MAEEEAEKLSTTTETERGGEGEGDHKTHIVFAVDDSDESMFALKWAMDKLIALDHPHLYQVYTLNVQPTLNIYPAPGFYITPEVMDSLKKSQEKTSLDILQRAKLVCDEKHVPSKTVSLVGDARDTICQAVEKLGADMLVMGSHGYGAIK